MFNLDQQVLNPQEKASAEIRGEFFRPNSRVNFAVDFLVDFFGPFSLEKNRRKKSTQKSTAIFKSGIWEFRGQNPHCKDPALINPTPLTCHKRKRKLRCSFRNAALQKLHCNIGFSAVRKSVGPEAALQQTKNCTATSKKLRCRKVALSCRFPAGFKLPRLGTHV